MTRVPQKALRRPGPSRVWRVQATFLLELLHHTPVLRRRRTGMLSVACSPRSTPVDTLGGGPSRPLHKEESTYWLTGGWVIQYCTVR